MYNNNIKAYALMPHSIVAKKRVHLKKNKFTIKYLIFSQFD